MVNERSTSVPTPSREPSPTGISKQPTSQQFTTLMPAYQPSTLERRSPKSQMPAKTHNITPKIRRSASIYPHHLLIALLNRTEMSGNERDFRKIPITPSQ